MLNRRQLRIKVFQILYAYYQSEDRDVAEFEKQLFFSIHKMYDMYLFLIALIIEMQHQAIAKIEAGLQKKLPAKEDLHPNTKFVTNIVLRSLANSKSLSRELERKSINWSENPDLVKQVFRELVATDDYKEYMASDERGYDHDREYLLRFFKRHMVNVEGLADHFEEKSIFWNDDLDLMASMVIKTIKQVEEDANEVELLPLWRADDDEEDFVKILFRQTLVKGDDYNAIIDDAASNWDIDRIALSDIIFMKMALAEAVSLPTIPLKVTLNEYIELSKYYSTPKSNGFINGVLDQLFTQLKEEGKIKKLGRGLVE
jgi:transcription antitermination protein NusB